MERCDKCGGFIMNDGKEVRCFNCGKRFIERDKLSQIYSLVCKQCGSTFYHPNKLRRLCDKCRKLKKKKYKCVTCGKEFIRTDYRVKECKDCRKKNRTNNKTITNNRVRPVVRRRR